MDQRNEKSFASSQHKLTTYFYIVNKCKGINFGIIKNFSPEQSIESIEEINKNSEFLNTF